MNKSKIKDGCAENLLEQIKKWEKGDLSSNALLKRIKVWLKTEVDEPSS
tara:strand:+ start:422 stop:568 length:147 start_codon:yes stop_codon:yes gene_type:complete